MATLAPPIPSNNEMRITGKLGRSIKYLLRCTTLPLDIGVDLSSYRDQPYATKQTKKKDGKKYIYFFQMRQIIQN